MKSKYLLAAAITLLTAPFAPAASSTPGDMALSKQWTASKFDVGVAT